MEGDLLQPSGNSAGKSGRRVKEIWEEIRETVAEKTRSYTLDEMAARKEAAMYYI